MRTMCLFNAENLHAKPGGMPSGWNQNCGMTRVSEAWAPPDVHCPGAKCDVVLRHARSS